MKVAKRFRWEAAHRLPWHQGDCSNLHGHSYTMTVELEGEPDERGMLIDFKEIKRILKPLVEAWDHSVLVAENDDDLRRAMAALGSRQCVLPFDTTAENLCTYAIDRLLADGRDTLARHGVHTVHIRIEETETCYAELSRTLTTQEPLRHASTTHHPVRV